MIRSLKAIFAALLFASMAHAGEPVAKVFLAGQGVWFNDQVAPSDFELGATARASLSPHISLVGGALYGTNNSYLRGTAGIRVTVSDVDQPNFSLGLGGFYQASSKVEVRPQEFNVDASLGYRPYPVTMPRVIVVAQGAYGLDSNQASLLLGLRYSLGYEEEREAP